MSESSGIDSIFAVRSMPNPCSLDLRERVLDAVETGASRREAAERFEVSPSSAIKWMQRWHETGSVAAKPTGGSFSPLEPWKPAAKACWLLRLVGETTSLRVIDAAGDGPGYPAKPLALSAARCRLPFADGRQAQVANATEFCNTFGRKPDVTRVLRNRRE
jgi:hypothetical protein